MMNDMAATASEIGTHVLDTKLGKLPYFDGKEQQWVEWAFQARAYCALLAPGMEEQMRAAEAMRTTIVMAELSQVAKHNARLLFATLVFTCRGVAAFILRRVQDNNGFEAWRMLCGRFEQTTTVTAAGTLRAILRFSFAGGVETIEQKLAEFDMLCVEYERTAFPESIGDSVRIGLLVEGLSEPLKSHAELNADRYTTWSELKQLVLSYARTKRPYMAPSAPGTLSTKPAGDGSGTVPMEIDYVGKGAAGRARERARAKGKARKARARSMASSRATRNMARSMASRRARLASLVRPAGVERDMAMVAVQPAAVFRCRARP